MHLPQTTFEVLEVSVILPINESDETFRVIEQDDIIADHIITTQWKSEQP